MKKPFIKKLTALASQNRRIFLITGDLGFGVFEEFEKRFPRQFLNAGVAEQNMMGIATGLALEGRIVFVYSIANFPLLRCLEQIRNDALYHQANVNIVAMGGGFSYGALGFSHHATEDLAIMRALPEMTILAPGDDWEVEGTIEALAAHRGPAYLRLDKSSAGQTNKPGEEFRLGKARILKEGSDITLVCTGGILDVVLQAAGLLEKIRISCRVLHFHTLRPFDRDALFAAVRQTGGIVTIEEHTVEGGLGSLVSEICLEQGIIPSLFCRLGLRQGLASVVGSQEFLRAKYGLDKDSIVHTVTNLLQVNKLERQGRRQ